MIPAKTSPSSSLTRVAVVQLDYHPAFVAGDRCPLEDPLFDPQGTDALLPEGGVVPATLRPRFDALRGRIRAAYCEQLLGRVRAALEACRAWGVRVVVFPEHSVPWDVLEGVAAAAGDVVVVAGSHSVDAGARASGVYQRLGASQSPAEGLSICPVLHRGRLLALVPRLSVGEDERAWMRPGEAWAPVPMPEGIPGPMGVLAGLDFLLRRSARLLGLAGLGAVRFLAVPSSLSEGATTELVGTVGGQAQRFGWPVLYSSGAGRGGSTICDGMVVPLDLRRFPERPGHLQAGDEGMVVADLDLDGNAATPVAEATFVYRGHPVGLAYARWLESVAPLLERDDATARDAVAARVARDRDLLLNAGAMSGAAARGRRMRRLVTEIDTIGDVETLRWLLREAVMPGDVLPMHELRAAMAGAAADVVFAWMKERDARAAGFGEVEGRLRHAVDQGKGSGSWTSEGVAAFARVAEAVRGTPEIRSRDKGGEAETEPQTGQCEEAPSPPRSPVRRLPEDWKQPSTRRVGDWTLSFQERPEDFRASTEESLQRSGAAEQRAAVDNARERSLAGGEASGLTEARIQSASDRFLLATALGADRVVTVRVQRDGAGGTADLAVAQRRHRDKRWTLWVDDDKEGASAVDWSAAAAALEEGGLPVDRVVRLGAVARAFAAPALLAWIERARDTIRTIRDRRLIEVGDHFEEPDARVDGGARWPILKALDAWLEGGESIALLLGEPGAGKSTALAVWATRLWEAESGPRPIVVDLAAMPATKDVEAMLLDAAGADVTPASRAALRLLIRWGLALPCFDGFDEAAARLTRGEIAGHYARLLSVIEAGGKILIVAREQDFPVDERGRAAAEVPWKASAAPRPPPSHALGAAAGARRLVVQPFDEHQIAALVAKVRTAPGAADEALRRIAAAFDLHDLTRRPLMLGMVLPMIERLDPGARVGTADLYEAYLQRWLEQTRSDKPSRFTDEQKVDLIESVADELWRSGEASCTWQDLHRSVRARLARRLPEEAPPAPAFADFQVGAFVVREGEGEDRYRFAHKSFLEYFLARGLVRTLIARPGEALDTRPITREIAAFLGEILRREGDARQAGAVRAVQAWLVTRAQRTAARGATSGDGAGAARAAANALRLLLGLSRWAGEGSGWIPEQADLRGADLVGEDLRGARLVLPDLRGADLSGADLSRAELSGAMLDHCYLSGASLHGATLSKVSAQRADLTQVAADGASLVAVDFTDAVLRQSVWIHCTVVEVRLAGADLTASLMALDAPPTAGAAPPVLAPPEVVPTLSAGHRGWAVHAVAWHPDGRRLASGADDGGVCIWDVASGKEIAWIEGGQGWVTAIAWDRDGGRLASAGSDGTVRVCEAVTAKEIVRFAEHTDTVLAIAWDPACERIASAGRDGTVQVWDAQSGKRLLEYELPEGQAKAVAWDVAGQRLAIAGNTGEVRILEASTGRDITILTGHQYHVRAVAWDPTGQRLASGGEDKTVRIWSTAGWQEILRLAGHPGSVKAIAWDGAGSRLATAGHDATIRIWDTASGQELFHLAGHTSYTVAVSWDAAGERVASGAFDNTIRIWDSRSGEELEALRGHTRLLSAIAWDAAGESIASAGADGVVRVWDGSSGKQVARLEGHTQGVRTVAWDGARGRLASGGQDGSVRIWDMRSGREAFRLEAYGRWVLSLAWAPDGGRIATAENDGTIHLWHVGFERGPITLERQVRGSIALEGHEKAAQAVAWSADGARIASAGDDGTVQIWAADTGERLARLSGHGGSVMAVAWLPGGRRLASAGEDGTIRLWSTERGRQIARLDGHSGSVAAVAWDPEGARFASAGYDGTVRIWDARDGKEMAALEGHTGMLTAVSWDPRGKRVASAGYDGTLRFWDPSAGRLLGVFEAAGRSALARTPAGFAELSQADPRHLALAVRRPEPQARSALYLPLAGLREIVHRPDLVRAALAGDLSGDDLRPDLAMAGLARDLPWDGEIHRVPRGAPPPPAAAPSEPPSPRPTAPPATLARAPAPAPKAEAARGPSFAPEVESAPDTESALVAKSVPVGESVSVTELAPAPVAESVVVRAAAPAFVNPFRPGPALTGAASLPGRDPVLADLLALIESHSPAVLRGPRRAGKTSLLHHLAARLAATHRVLHKTLEATDLRTADDLARFLDPARDPAPADSLRNRLHGDPPAVLLLDEIANLGAADPSVFAWLRAVGQEGTAVVLVGSPWDWVQIVEHAAKAPGSSFGNDVTPVTLGPIPEPDALDFLVGTAPPDVPLQRELTARWIVDLCGPWPFYLQVLGYAVVQAVRAGQRLSLVEPRGVYDLYEQRLLLERDAAFFRARWAELPGRARRVLWRLRASPGADLPVYRDLPPEDRKALRDTGLCDALGRWLQDKPFYDWIRRIADDDAKEA